MLSLFLSLCSASLLMVLLIQDVRKRAVSVVLFPLLLLCLTLMALVQEPLYVVLEAWGRNVLFLIVQVGIVYLYFFLTRRRWVPVIGAAIGLGDILFWLVGATSFSFLNFIFFFLGSMLFALLLHGLLRGTVIKIKYSATVPLAGFQSLALLLLLLLRELYPGISFFDDTYMLELFL